MGRFAQIVFSFSPPPPILRFLRRMVLSVLPRLLAVAVLAGSLGAPLVRAAAYKGAIVIDLASGQTLFEAEPDFVTPPASVTKLMTFLVVHEEIASGRIALSAPVTVSAEAARMGSSQVYLAQNEVFSVEELLYALMVSSANDAALALAEAVAGSREAFVTRMNARAGELGMKRTTFTSPHGLPPANRRLEEGDLTTPRDLALLSAHLLAKTDILRYASVKERVFRPGPRQIDMRNHNNLLGKVTGVDGLKTGFTRGAGFCLAATAQRDGRRLVAVTMGSPTSQVRDLEIADLFEKAFASLPPVPTIRPEGAEPPPLAAATAYPEKPKAAAPDAAPKSTADDAPQIQPAAEGEVPAVRFVMPGRSR